MSITQQDTATTATGGPRVRDLVVDDIVAARDDLIARGVEVSDIWHIEPGRGRASGVDPQRRSYLSRASFADHEGNAWTLQELTARLPGRMELHDAGALARLLFETARRHGAFGAVDPAQAWWDWYGAYVDARQEGRTPEQAAEVAGYFMADAGHVAVASA